MGFISLDLDFFYGEENIEFVQKKRHGQNFASIDSIINQNESTHMPVVLIGCGNIRSIILGVSFFNKLFQSEILFFSKIKKKKSKHFFYEKIVSVLFFFL